MINATCNRMTREIARQSGLADRIDKLQVQVSRGKRLQPASADAVSWRRLATNGKAEDSADAWQTHILAAQAPEAPAGGGRLWTNSRLKHRRGRTIGRAARRQRVSEIDEDE